MRTRLALALLFCFGTASLTAATLDFKVLIDADNNTATGCGVDGMSGVEHELVASVTAGETAGVTSFKRRACTGSTFGPSTDVSAAGWQVGIGPSGQMDIETSISRAALGIPGDVEPMRLGFVGTFGPTTQAIIANSDGTPILHPKPPHGKRRAVGKRGTTRIIVLDGLVADWFQLTPVVESGATSTTNFNLDAAYVFIDAVDVFFRFAATANLAAPTATDDSYTVIQGTTLPVGAPGVLQNDSDPAGSPLTASKLTDPTHGHLSLSPNGQFTYFHDGSSAAADSFQYQAMSALGAESNPASVNITIAPNEPPTAVADAYTVAEGGTLSIAAPGVFANDSDSDTPQNAWSVNVVNNPTRGTLTLGSEGAFTYVHNGTETTSDSFTYQIDDGFSFSNTVTVSITVTPVNDAPVASSASVTTVEDTPLNINVVATDAEGDSLTYEIVSAPANGSLTGTGPSFTYTPIANSSGSDSFIFVASDGKAQSAPATISITITAADDAPVAVADSYGVTPTGTLHVGAAAGVLANDSDPDGDGLTASLVSTTANGALTMNADGSFDYAPNGFTGTAAFTYRAVETIPAALTSAITTVSINVHSTNQPPAANAQSPTTQEDTPLALTLTGSDPDGDTLSFAVVSQPTHGTLTGSGPSHTYTPFADYNGPDSFTFTVSDGFVTSTATVSITVTPLNDAPDAVGDAYAVIQNTTLNVAATGVLTNDSDVDGDTLTAILDTNVTHGTLALNADGSFTYTPTTGFNGTDSFTYHARDAAIDSSIVTVQLTVKAKNTAPVAQSQNVTTDEDTQKVIVLGGSDADNDPLTFTVTTQPSHGTLNGTAPNLVYTPDADYNGSDSFSFTVSDGIATSAAATVSITVTPINDAPVATGDSYNFVEDATLTVAAPGLLTNDSDGDGDLLSAVLVSNAGNGVLTLNPNGGFNYTPATNFSGVDAFTYRAGDGTLQSNLAHVTIVVTSVNDAPVNILPVAQAVLEESTLTFSTGNSNAITTSDVDSNGSVEQVTLTATNGNLTLGATAGITITGGANNSPTVTITGTISALNGAMNGTVYAPTANFSGAATLTIASDDLGNTGAGGPQADTDVVSITVTDVNDIPSFTKGVDQTLNEDAGPQTATNWATAISTGPAAESSQTVHFNVSNDNNGLFSTQPAVSATGTLTFTTAPNANGSATVTINIQDDGGVVNGGVDQSANQTFTITVNPVNDAPAFTKGVDESVLEDSAAHTATNWATGISAGPADESGQTLTFNVSNDNNALFTVQPAVNSTSGTLTYTLAGDRFGTATVTVTLSDNGGILNGGADTSAAQTFTITVTNINDVPSFTAGANQTFNEDSGAHSIGNWATAINPGPNEGSQTADFIVSNDNNSLFTSQPAVAADGTLTFTSAPDAFGSATVDVRIHDNGGIANGGVDTSAVQQFTITINPVNDVPSFTKGAGEAVLEDSGAHSVTNWATSLSKGPANESTQTLTFNVSNNSNVLFAVQPAVDASGNLTYTLATNAFGTATVTVTLSDNGGILNGGIDTSAAQTFDIAVTNVNDVPSFTAGPNQTFNEDSGAHSISTWASAINPGPTEGSQTVDFIVTNNNNSLFSSQPALAADGTLTFTSAPDAVGSATVDVKIHDNGGVLNGGVDTSAVQQFTITIDPVNDAPSFTKGADEAVLEDSGAHSVTNWATSLSKGPADESTQTLAFNLSNNSNTMFAVQPDIDASGNLTYTLAANAFGIATVTVTLSDDGGILNGGVDTSAAQTFDIVVTNVNDVPSFTAGSSQTFNEDSGLHSIGPWATAINAGPNEGAQAVDFIVTNSNNSLFSSQPAVAADGTLTFTSLLNAFGSATVDVTIHDNGGILNGGVDTSAVQQFTITINSVNDPPVVTAGGTLTYTENDPATAIDTALTITDIENDNITSATVTISNNFNAAQDLLQFATFGAITFQSYTGGVLTISGSDTRANYQAALRTVTYANTSDNPTTADRTVTWIVNDGDPSVAKTSTVTVLPVNDAPAAVADSYPVISVNTLSPAAPGVLTNDTDAETVNTALTALLVSGPFEAEPGFVLNADGSFAYKHNDAGPHSPTDSFTYKVNDGTVDGNTVTVTINITYNQPPVGNNDSYTVTEGLSALTPNASLVANGVLANDTDADGDPRTAVMVTGPTHAAPASFNLNADGTFTYTHDGAEPAGADSFTYRPSDTIAGQGNLTTVTINITAVNDSPVAAADSYNVNEGATLTASPFAAGVLNNDSDEETANTSLTASIITPPVHNSGAFTLNANGTFTYIHDGTNTGNDSFTYRASDGNTFSNTVTVALVVAAINDAPVANNDSYNVNEAATLTISSFATGVINNDTDEETPNTSLTATLLTPPARHSGGFTLNANGTFTYVHDGSETTSDSFTYKVSDGLLDSNTATVNITVNAVNDPPALDLDNTSGGTGFAFTFTEGDAATRIEHATGATVTDADNANLSSMTVTITNLQNGALELLDANVGGTLINKSYTAATGVLLLNNSDTVANYQQVLRTITYLNTSENPGITARVINVVANDGANNSNTAVSTGSVVAVNDAPVAVNDSGGAYNVFKRTATSSTSLTIAAPGVLSNDTDAELNLLTVTTIAGQAVIVGGTTAATSQAGSVTMFPDGHFTYVPALNFTGNDTFTYVISDGSLGSNTATVTIAVNNHAPTVGADSYTGVGNTVLEVKATATPDTNPRVQLVGNLLTNDSDLDGDALTAVAQTVSSTAPGSSNNVVINADGTFTYTPLPNVTSDTFNYLASDGSASNNTTSGTVTLTLSNKVWYVRNNGAAGNGVSSTPFNTLAAAAAASAANDFIYVFTGDGATTNQNAGITLKNNQQLIGADADLIVGASTLAIAGGTKPQITHTAGDAVTAADGNMIKGVNLTGASGSGLLHSGKNGLTIDRVTFTDSANGLTITTPGATAINVTNTIFTGTAGNRVNISGGSNAITIDSTNTIGSTTASRTVSIAARTGGTIAIGAAINDGGAGILINNSAAGNSTFNFTGTQTLNTTTNAALTLQGNTGTTTTTFSGTLIISTTSGAAINTSGSGANNSLSITGANNTVAISALTGTGINLSAARIGTSNIVFRSVNITGGATGISIAPGAGSTGTFTVAGTGGACANGTDPCTGGTIQNQTTSGITHAGVAGGGVVTINSIKISGAVAGVTTTGTNPSTALNTMFITGGTNSLSLGGGASTSTTITALTTAASTGASITGNTFGTLTVSAAANTISGTSALALTTGTVSGTFSSVSATGGNVSLTGVAGTWGTTGGTLAGAAGAAAFNVLGSSSTIAWAGDITQSAANATINVAVNGATNDTSAITFTGNITANLGTGLVFGNANGSYLFQQANPKNVVIHAGGILIATSSSGTFNWNTRTSMDSTISATPLTINTSTGAITYSGTIAVTQANAYVVDITSLNTPGSLTMSGSVLSASTNTSVNGIRIQTSSSTAISIAPTSLTLTMQNNDGITLTNNTNASGSISITGIALTATGGNPRGAVITGGGRYTLGGSINTSGGGGSGVVSTGAFSALINLTSLAVTSAGADAVNLSGGGTLNSSGTTAITSSTGQALILNGVALTSGASMSSISSGGGANGISFTNVTAGAMTVTGGAIAGNSTAGFNSTTSTASFSYGGTITNNTVKVINISNVAAGGCGTLAFSGNLSATAGTGITVNNCNAGTITFSGATKSINTAANPAITLSNNTAAASINFTNGGLQLTTTTATAFNATGGTVTVQTGGNNNTISTTSGTALNIVNATVGAGGATFATVSSSSATIAVNLDTFGNGFVNINGGTISNANTRGLDINGGAGNVTFAASITTTGTAAATHTIEVTGHTGGTVIIAGSITDGAGGINLTGNGGATITFNGGMAVSTGANPAFTATGGGTVNVCDEAACDAALTGALVNTLATTSGTALTVTSTTIGTGYLEFRSISASGGTNGILLNTTGSGGLKVVGTSTTDGTGGTIQNTTGRGASFISASNILLKNMTFTNAGTSDLDADNSGLSTGDNLSANAAIHLETVTGAEFDNVDIAGGAEMGVNGNTVSAFKLKNSTITNVGNAADEDNIHFYNMSGASEITSTTLTHTSGGGDDNMNLQMQSGTLNLTITGGSAVGVGGGVNQQGSGYLFGIRGTSNATITFSGASSTDNFSGGIVADAYDTARMDLAVINSTSSGNNDQLSVSAGDSSNVNLTATGNTLSSVLVGDFVVVGLLGSALDNGYKFSSFFQNNTITVANDRVADGMLANNVGGGEMNVSVITNTFNYGGTQRPMVFQTGQDGAGDLSIVVQDNTINMQFDVAGDADVGILAQSGVASPTGDGSTLDADIGGPGTLANDFSHTAGLDETYGGDIRLRQRFENPIRLADYTGGAADTAAVIAYVNGRNNEVIASTASTAAALPATIPFANAPTVTVSAPVAENGGNLTFTLTRTGSIVASQVVSFSMSGSANFVGGADYTVTGATTYNSTTGTGTATFAAGGATTVITIDPTNDGTVERDESVWLDVVGGTFARGIITNDD